MLSIAVLWTSLASMMTAILQATGKVNLPIFSVFIGGLIKLGFNYILVGNEKIGIYGAPFSTNLCYIAIFLINLYFIKKHVDVNISIVKSFFKPVISVTIMGIVAHFTFTFLVGFIPSSVSLIVSIGISGVAYLALIFITGAIDDSDLALIPGGSKLKKLAKKHDSNN